VTQSTLIATPKAAKTPHQKAEFYATDADDVRDFFRLAFHSEGPLARLLDRPGDDNPIRMLDPCAGGARGHGMPYAEVATEYGLDVVTMDKRADSLAEHVGDFLVDDAPAGPFELVCSNPPFSLYPEFVERALELAPICAFLLPLQVTEPRKRTFEADLGWWREHRPVWCVEHKRLKFSGAKSSAFQQYGHFIWVRGHQGPWRPTQHISAYDLLELSSSLSTQEV
jgi:hypothetical protein